MDSQGTSRPAEFDDYGAPRRDRRAPSVVLTVADLALVTATVIAVLVLAFAFGEFGGPTAVRVPLGFLFVFFLPGYALTAALFPYADSTGERQQSERSVNTVDRLVLSVGLSLVLVPVLSVGLTMISQPIELFSVLPAVGGATLAFCGVAAVRRIRVSPRERYFVSPGPTVRSVHGFLRADALNAVLVLALVLSVGGIGAALVTAEDGTTYSEFAVLTGEDGELVADDYPSELSVNESEQFYLEVTNHERETVEYTVVVLLEDMSVDGERAAVTELDRQTVELDHGERTLEEHAFEPPRTGENLRLSYLLYVDDVPEEPTVSTAYRAVHVSLNVTE